MPPISASIIDMCELIGCPQSWSILIPWAAGSWQGKSVSSSVNRLCFAASVYYIWRERNCRIFKSLTCPPNVTLKAILNTVRSKICSFGLKISTANNFIASTWNIPLSWARVLCSCLFSVVVACFLFLRLVFSSLCFSLVFVLFVVLVLRVFPFS